MSLPDVNQLKKVACFCRSPDDDTNSAPTEITSIKVKFPEPRQNTTPLYERASTIPLATIACPPVLKLSGGNCKKKIVLFVKSVYRSWTTQSSCSIIMQDDTIENRSNNGSASAWSKEDLEKLANYLNRTSLRKNNIEFQSTLKNPKRDDERRLQELSIFLFEKALFLPWFWHRRTYFYPRNPTSLKTCKLKENGWNPWTSDLPRRKKEI